MTVTEVMKAVRRHHDSVCEKANERNVSVIMTVLDGSQNYGLDHAGSDIDTFSFVLPSVRDMSQLKEPITTEYWVEDGKCSVKDIRLALNLLIKTSPNSLEWFTSKFQIKEPDYENILAYYLAEPILNQMIHSNYFHMLKACEGMSHQLSKRNMPVGKRYSHCLRMIDMWETYLKGDKHPLSFRSEENRLVALNAKLSQNEDMQEKCEEVADYFHRIAKEFSITEEQKQKEQEGQKLVRQFEYDLMMRHLYREMI